MTMTHQLAKATAEKILAARSPSMERGIFDALYATIRRQAQDVIEREVEAALLQVLREQDWQPIATAPKDGRLLLVYVEGAYQFAGWVDGEWRILMPPARGWGYGVHGNWAPLLPGTLSTPLPPPPSPSEEEKAK